IGVGDNDPLVWLAWAEVEAAFGDNKRARAVLNRAVQQNVPGLFQEMNSLHDSEVTPGPDGALKANTLLLHNCTAGSFLNRLSEWWGHLHPARSGYATREQWALEEPQNAQAQWLWGEALTRNRDYRRAEKALRQALALAPRSPEAHLAMAAYFSGMGQEGDARAGIARAAA
ncbi:MAG: tetratricopeptide repeat protein, partial [Armatimonadota bacterium]|nr:tetratricopeptide repeat protein [Armatimonadota bacterium]